MPTIILEDTHATLAELIEQLPPCEEVAILHDNKPVAILKVAASPAPLHPALQHSLIEAFGGADASVKVPEDVPAFHLVPLRSAYEPFELFAGHHRAHSSATALKPRAVDRDVLTKDKTNENATTDGYWHCLVGRQRVRGLIGSGQ